MPSSYVKRKKAAHALARFLKLHPHNIFVRFMNNVPFQKVVTTWMAEEPYRRLRVS